jgi:hypothetical protein
MTSTKPLRAALLTNAMFSLGCALLLGLAPGLVGSWLGFQSDWILRGIGLGLGLFAADLIHQTTRPRLATWRALYASTADLLWVVGSLVGLAVFAEALSRLGLATVAAVAAIVFALGVWQLWGIHCAHWMPTTRRYRHCLRVQVNAPATALGEVVTRLGDIHRYMGSLQSSEILGGRQPGVGAVRQCTNHSGQSWAEECVAFEPGQSFVVRFLAEAPGFPFPARAMVGGWAVTPVETGSEVMVWWELVPKPALLAPVLLPILAFQVDRDFPPIVQNMAKAALGTTAEAVSSSALRFGAKLMPRWC